MIRIYKMCYAVYNMHTTDVTFPLPHVINQTTYLNCIYYSIVVKTYIIICTGVEIGHGSQGFQGFLNVILKLQAKFRILGENSITH